MECRVDRSSSIVSGHKGLGLGKHQGELQGVWGGMVIGRGHVRPEDITAHPQRAMVTSVPGLVPVLHLCFPATINIFELVRKSKPIFVSDIMAPLMKLQLPHEGRQGMMPLDAWPPSSL